MSTPAYTATMNAVLYEIETFKQRLPGLLKELERDEMPSLCVIGVSKFSEVGKKVRNEARCFVGASK